MERAKSTLLIGTLLSLITYHSQILKPIWKRKGKVEGRNPSVGVGDCLSTVHVNRLRRKGGGQRAREWEERAREAEREARQRAAIMMQIWGPSVLFVVGNLISSCVATILTRWNVKNVLMRGGYSEGACLCPGCVYVWKTFHLQTSFHLLLKYFPSLL